jgi:FAD/FMN-containing dehydrogenase
MTGTRTLAFSGRATGYIYNLISTWTDPVQDATHIGANRALAAALAPHSTSRTHINFTTETDSDRVRAAFGDEIYDRLARLKRHYDPANLFCRNQNIHPAH